MSWFRAAVVGVVIVAVAAGVLVYVPDALLSLSGMSRTPRVALATGWFTVALVGLLWGLRKLQSRGLTG